MSDRSTTHRFSVRAALFPRLSAATLLIAGFAALQAGNASAATLKVPGAYPTLAAAVGASQPGDTLEVAAGTYREAVDLSGLTGLTLRGAGAGKTTLETSGGSGIELTEASHISIQSLTLRGATLGINLAMAHDITVQDCEVKDVTYGVSSYDSYNVYLRRNRLEGGEIGFYSYRDWAVDPDGTSDYLLEENEILGANLGVFIDSSRRMVLRGNTFLDSQNIAMAINVWDNHEIFENLFSGGPVGLWLIEVDDEVWPPAFRTTAMDAEVLIHNNIFHQFEAAAIYGESEPWNGTRFWVRNNIFHQNAGTAIFGTPATEGQVQTWDSQLLIAYNTFYGNGSDFGGGLSTTGRRLSARNQFTDPRFVAPESGDFSLQTGSRSVDTGTLDVNGDGVADLTVYQGRSRDRGIEER